MKHTAQQEVRMQAFQRQSKNTMTPILSKCGSGPAGEASSCTPRVPKGLRRKSCRTLYMFYSSDFRPFSSHGTHNLIAKTLQRTKERIFCRSDKQKYGIILISSHGTATVVLAAVVICLLGDLRKTRSVPLTQ